MQFKIFDRLAAKECCIRYIATQARPDLHREGNVTRDRVIATPSPNG
jgi:hypothetical protein